MKKVIYSLFSLIPVLGFSQGAYLVGGADFSVVSGPPGDVNYPDPSAIADGITNAPGAYNGYVAPTLPVTLILEFEGIQDIEGFSLFTHVGANHTDALRDFSLVFYDSSDALLFNYAGTASNLTNAWQDWSIDLIEGVSRVELSMLSGYSGTSGIELSEIRFSTPVPEPGPALLLGVALLAPIFHRRRVAGNGR